MQEHYTEQTRAVRPDEAPGCCMLPGVPWEKSLPLPHTESHATLGWAHADAPNIWPWLPSYVIRCVKVLV